MLENLSHWKKKQLWLLYLLPLLFFSDVLYGGLNYLGIETSLTPGLLLRGLILLASIHAVVKYLRYINKSLYVWLIIIFFSAMPGVITGLFYGGSLFYDLAALVKILYLPLVTSFFVILKVRFCINDDEILRYVESAAYVLGISLLVSQQLGIQRETYGDYAFGSTGIFYAQNDLTLAFGLALLAAAYRLVFVHFTFWRLILLILSCFACVQIGTRASLGVVLGIAFTLVICSLWGSGISTEKAKTGQKFKKLFIAIVLVLGTSAVFIYGFSKQQEHSYQQEKFQQLAEGEFPRLLLLIAGLDHLSSRPGWQNVTGEGASSFQHGVALYFSTVEEKCIVEVDWVDMFGAYGPVFTLFLYSLLIYVFFCAARNFLTEKSAVNGVIASATFLYFVHSALAGHALVSPIPSTLVSAYFSLFFDSRNSNILYGDNKAVLRNSTR